MPLLTADPVTVLPGQREALEQLVRTHSTPQPQAVMAPVAPPLTPAKEMVRAMDPRGGGDPEAMTCRTPQLLPGSRLPALS